MIKNTCDLNLKIRNTNILNNSELVSFDVWNIFSAIPIQKCRNRIEDIIINSPNISRLKKIELLTAVNLTLTQNNFKFKNTFYKQKNGLPMGIDSFSFFADIFMEVLKKDLLNKSNNKKCMYTETYVDDTIVLWNGTNRQFDDFFKHINWKSKKKVWISSTWP